MVLIKLINNYEDPFIRIVSSEVTSLEHAKELVLEDAKGQYEDPTSVEVEEDKGVTYLFSVWLEDCRISRYALV